MRILSSSIDFQCMKIYEDVEVSPIFSQLDLCNDNLKIAFINEIIIWNFKYLNRNSFKIEKTS